MSGQREIPVHEVVTHILSGLYTDGAHHKQWALEMALDALLGPIEAEKLREKEAAEVGWAWDEGIAP